MLKVKEFTLGMFQVHNYLLYDTDTRESVLFDTGKNPDDVLSFLSANELDLKILLYTHTHIDHVEGHSTIRAAYPDLPAWMHTEEQFWVDALDMQAQMFGMTTPEPPVITGFVEHGQTFELGNMTIESRFCPGHTPGGISYYVPEGPFVFTGDTIFAGAIGRTDFPRGNFTDLMHSIETQILTLPDDTLIYSGHGPVTTVGEERRSNPYVLQHLTADSRSNRRN
jgi:glyoxylase-like metal-dependent hydrolase (beta-lactamase superfamily II)